MPLSKFATVYNMSAWISIDLKRKPNRIRWSDNIHSVEPITLDTMFLNTRYDLTKSILVFNRKHFHVSSTNESLNFFVNVNSYSIYTRLWIDFNSLFCCSIWQSNKFGVLIEFSRVPQNKAYGFLLLLHKTMNIKFIIY